MDAGELATVQRYCRKCSYDLRGLESRRCPECGRAFDPADAKTFRRRPRSSFGKWLRRAGVCAAILLVLASLPYLWLYWEWRREQPAIKLATAPGGEVFCTRAKFPLDRWIVPERIDWLCNRAEVMCFGSEGSPLKRADLQLLGRCNKLLYIQNIEIDSADSDLDPILRLPLLHTLDLWGETANDTTARVLARSPKLSRLAFNHSSVSDAGLEALASDPALIRLTVESDRITGKGLAALSNCTSLEVLILASNGIRASDLETFAFPPKLRYLSIYSDACTAAAQKRLREAHPGADIYLRLRSDEPVDGATAATPPATAPAAPDRPWARDLAVGVDRAGSIEKSVTMSSAQSPREMAERVDALFSAAPTKELDTLVVAPDCAAALAAGWERVRRTMPREKQRAVVSPGASAMSRFLGLIEGRTRFSIPPFWEASMRSLQCYSRRQFIFGEPKDSYSISGVRPIRKGDHWIVTTGNQTISLPAKDELGPVDSATVELSGQTAYVTLYGWLPDPYRLYAVDRSSGKVVWASEVWASGNLVIYQGPGWHVVEMRVEGNCVAIFGVSMDCAYIEVFDTKNGKNECRFSTRYFEPVATKGRGAAR